MANLSTAPGYTNLKPGDPFTFVSMTDEQMRVAHELSIGGRTAQWFSTAESGRVFRIVRIDDVAHACETVYLGFEVEPDSYRVDGNHEQT